MPHLLNIAVHILAGLLAILLGLYLLWAPKHPRTHRRWGRVFVGLTLVVCTTAVIGNAVFRFLPVFAVLTLVVSYQLLSGWHVIYTRANGPDARDAWLLCGGAVIAMALANHLRAPGVLDGAPVSVVLSTLAAVVLLLAYDAARWLFPRQWHGVLWRYEHIYKIVASLFSMLSAAVGNTVRAGQPWSQLLPSGIGLVVIVWCGVREYRRQRAASSGLPA